MERKKKEKKEDSCLPKVSSRKKPYLTLTHRLEKSGLEIKVSAKNEDWLKFREHYIFHPNKLLRDFLPIMEVAYLHSKPKTRHKKGQPKIDVLKVFSAKTSKKAFQGGKNKVGPQFYRNYLPTYKNETDYKIYFYNNFHFSDF